MPSLFSISVPIRYSQKSSSSWFHKISIRLSSEILRLEFQAENILKLAAEASSKIAEPENKIPAAPSSDQQQLLGTLGGGQCQHAFKEYDVTRLVSLDLSHSELTIDRFRVLQICHFLGGSRWRDSWRSARRGNTAQFCAVISNLEVCSLEWIDTVDLNFVIFFYHSTGRKSFFLGTNSTI